MGGREDSQVKVNGFRVELGEIDKSLLRHEHVDNAVTIVHDNQLAAYIELKQSQYELGESEHTDYEAGTVLQPLDERWPLLLRQYCASTLPEYMVPRFITLLDKLPLSTNGKVQRNKLPLPQSSALDDDDFIAPRDLVESQVCDVFAQVLDRATSTISVTSSFFELGGDSLSALRLLIALHEALFVEVSIPTLFQNPTIVAIATIVQQHRLKGQTDDSSKDQDGQKQIQLLTIREGQSTAEPSHSAEDSTPPPLFLVHPAGASALAYRGLAEQLDPRQAVYALEDASLGGLVSFTLESIEAVAKACAALVRGVLPSLTAPCVIGGWSYGGVVALQLASQLEEVGVMVELVAMFDAPLRVNEFDVLEYIGQELRHPVFGISCRDVQHQQKTYAGVFTGSDLVDWLIQRQHAKSRDIAAEIGQQLVSAKVIGHVVSADSFKDDKLLYNLLDSFAMVRPDEEAKGAMKGEPAVVESDLIETIHELTLAQARTGNPSESTERKQVLCGIAEAAVEHFRNCNDLLQRHTCQVRLACKILDFRPVEVDPRVPQPPVRHLTEREDGVQHHLVPGSHWTMLFGENVEVVGGFLQFHLEQIGANRDHLWSHEGSNGDDAAIPGGLLGAAVIINHFEKPYKERARSLSTERVRSMDGFTFRAGRSSSAW